MESLFYLWRWTKEKQDNIFIFNILSFCVQVKASAVSQSAKAGAQAGKAMFGGGNVRGMVGGVIGAGAGAFGSVRSKKVTCY